MAAEFTLRQMRGERDMTPAEKFRLRQMRGERLEPEPITEPEPEPEPITEQEILDVAGEDVPEDVPELELVEDEPPELPDPPTYLPPTGAQREPQFNTEEWARKIQQDPLGAERDFRRYQESPAGQREMNRLRASPGQRSVRDAQIRKMAREDHKAGKQPNEYPESLRTAKEQLKYRTQRQKLLVSEHERLQFAKENPEVLRDTVNKFAQDVAEAGLSDTVMALIENTVANVPALPAASVPAVIEAVTEAAAAEGRAGFRQRVRDGLDAFDIPKKLQNAIVKAVVKNVLPAIPEGAQAAMTAAATARDAFNMLDAVVPESHSSKRYIKTMGALVAGGLAGAGTMMTASAWMDQMPNIPWYSILQDTSQLLGDPKLGGANATALGIVNQVGTEINSAVVSQHMRKNVGLATDIDQHASDTINYVADVAKDKGYEGLSDTLKGAALWAKDVSAPSAAYKWLMDSYEAAAKDQPLPPPPPPPPAPGLGPSNDAAGGGATGGPTKGGAGTVDPADKLLLPENVRIIQNLLKSLTKDQKLVILSKIGAMADSFRARFAKSLFDIGAGISNVREAKGLGKALVSRDMQLDRMRNAQMMTTTAKNNAVRNSLRPIVPRGGGLQVNSLSYL